MGRHAAVARGVGVWNASGVRIRFVRSYSPKRAQLIIRNSRDVPTGSCGGGMATDGYVRPHAYVNILHGSAKDGMRCSVYAQTLVVAHELGHVLGFAHDDARCSVMNSTFLEGYAPAECVGAEGLEPHRGSWDCRLLERIDVVRAAHRYGGTIKPRPAEQWCDFVPRMAAPTITATWDPVEGRAHLTIRRPASVPLPAFLLAEDRHPELYDLISSAACHPDPPTEQEMAALVRSHLWTVAAGGDELRSDASMAPGSHWCWTVWARDALGRATAAATAELDVPAETPVE